MPLHPLRPKPETHVWGQPDDWSEQPTVRDRPMKNAELVKLSPKEDTGWRKHKG